MTSRPSLSDDIAAVELPQWLDHPSSGAPASEREKLEDDPSLDLPLPIAPRPAPFIRLRLWNREFLVMSDLQAIRTVKSTLLVAKVRDQIHVVMLETGSLLLRVVKLFKRDMKL